MAKQATVSQPKSPIAVEKSPAIEVPAKTTPTLASTELGPSKQEQIKRFEGNGIAYCKTCIRTLQTGESDVPICPINKPDCDRNKLGG